MRKKRERPMSVPSVPSPSLLSHCRSCRWAEISVPWPQLHWGQLSASLCWNYGLAFCPWHRDLAVTLNKAHPRGWQILSPHFPNFAQETNPTHQPTATPTPPVAFPNLISHLRHNGKNLTSVKRNLLKFMENKGMCWNDKGQWVLEAFPADN